MKKMQRILSILLTMAVMLSLNPPVQAAEGEGLTLSMTASVPNTKVGESISLTVRAAQDFSARGCGMTICYDPDVLALDLENSSAAAPFAVNGPMEIGDKTAVRISFLPGLDTVKISASDALAVVKFKALSVTEQSEITMAAVHFYDSSLTEISVMKPAEVKLAVEPGDEYIPVSGITLDQGSLTLEEGEMAALKATIAPLGASNPAVTWTTSNDAIVKVSGGALKALCQGTATITATTVDGGFSASCTVTVTPPKAGYTVKMPADTTAVIGETVQIPVVISNEDGNTGYNAFDLNFTYDPSVLELVTDKLAGMSLNVTSGSINVLGYGEYRSVGSIPFTLEFRALKSESTELLLAEARVDNYGNAVVKNASLATLLDDRTAITVAGYPVSLPEGFTGEETAKPGVDYIFREPSDAYDYTVKATVDGVEVKVKENKDGSYTIPAESVKGEIVVTATKTGKIFLVTLGTDMTGEATAQYGKDYTATITRDESYRYTVTVFVNGKEYTGYTVLGDTYDAWAWLVIAEDTFDEDTARSYIEVGDGRALILAKPDCDVNGTDLVDVNDAQLVYDLYNGKYQNFRKINMIKFLNADVNLDRELTVMDAAAVVASIE